MRKIVSVLGIMFIILALSACAEDNLNDELPMLEVEFELPESADVGDTIELKATVIYGDEPVKDATEVKFEYWENDDKDNSVSLESTNHNDGTYTAEVTFENNAIFSIYAHTTARTLHTMPLRSITVGDVDLDVSEDNDSSNHDSTKGFGLHFMNPQDVKSTIETELMVHLTIDDNDFENATVRFEIWQEDISDTHDWVDAKESTAGEYVATHIFPETGTYTIEVHVENDEGIHEHESYQVDVE